MSTHEHLPRVSCVIAVYNGQAYLHEAIDSLLAQTYPNVEIIVVDDGSTDGTPGVIDRYGHRVRALAGPNAGVSIARNRGVEISSGQLLCFLDADDLLEPSKIATQADALIADPQLNFCDCHSSFFWSPELSVDALVHDDRFSQPFWHQSLPGHISTWMFRRELWDRVGGFSGALRFSEDVDWISRARDLPMRSRTLPQVMAHRRLHPGNVTARRGIPEVAALADVLKAHLKRTRVRSAG